MGKRGPLSKAEGRQRREKLTVVSLDRQRKAPEAPRGLLMATRAGWEAYWRSDVSLAVGDEGIDVVRRLFKARDEQERCRRAYRKEMLVAGSTGQIRLNPLADHALKLEAVILRLETELGLTPMAKARLGIAVGAARLTAADVNKMAEERDEDED